MEFLAGGHAEVRITRADVGKRVSVRRLTGGGAGEPAFTDAVGVLTSWDEGVLSITRRNGECVRIEESSLVAAKVVPARRPAAGPQGSSDPSSTAPARRRGPSATALELQRIAARGWPAAETEPLGEWTLRASGGFTRRANSVLPLGDPGVPLDTALERIGQWYDARGLPAVITVATGRAGTDEELAAALAERGWAAERHTRVRIAALAPLADLDTGATDTPRGSAGAAPARVVLSREPDADWLALYNRTGEGGPTGEAARDALKVLTGGPSVWFATVHDADGRAAAIGRLVVDGRWAGFAAVEVAPAARRRGLATRVMAALAERALTEGASAAYLQVEADNTDALAFYDRLGFTDHHGYHYRRALPGGGRH
ncbi:MULTISPECIES: GNAT family N-acetyltransferase [unclassified Streptomyces]|uniref:GNAT family N-acetyltransferase n=1 Tax=unclassified Streptomyces TaxID=2593676 RepID=UPI000887D99B|nr:MULTISPECIES: GNAT family N-acetyltransferase [unclassified Streptomyces]PBC84877.1 acetyltransferase (GNAT) family protein [Streptomyces sp. 2321.6]SDR25304.1 Acetyltransferase (GNAT) family protein [Streptomyces sp. KS_16]SED47799.1 Acetyltransferase (GNAT) family protein [Streptomyces sp. 2133.1]SEE38406.1 Acetyltransferase (GNAT) family protein [Streptomyces sp. 2112.3]SNC70900.1 Acetyltransferase (GNAT) family protein [Streptomyces sp. 2114.4]